MGRKGNLNPVELARRADKKKKKEKVREQRRERYAERLKELLNPDSLEKLKGSLSRMETVQFPDAGQRKKMDELRKDIRYIQRELELENSDKKENASSSEADSDSETSTESESEFLSKKAVGDQPSGAWAQYFAGAPKPSIPPRGRVEAVGPAKAQLIPASLRRKQQVSTIGQKRTHEQSVAPPVAKDVEDMERLLDDIARSSSDSEGNGE